MPQPTLPAELIRAIIKLVHDEGGLPEVQSALAACCLTSKAFLPHAREKLYRRVHLSPYRHNALQTILSAPHVASLVQALAFQSWNADPAESPSVRDSLTPAIATCTNVREITLSFQGEYVSYAGEAVQEALASSAGTLETLELEDSNDWLLEDLSESFSPFARLRHLRIDDVLYDRPYHFSTLPTFRLERFEAHQGLDAAVLRAILSNSTESLESLTIDVTVEGARLKLRRFKSLHTITLRWHPLAEDLLVLLDLEPLFKSLGTCTNLKTLRLAHGPQEDQHLPSEQFDALPFLRHLPPSLTSFRDSACLGLNTANLLEILSYPRHRLLPNLERMFVPSLFSDRYTWEFEERDTEDKQLCEDAAMARGVELEWGDWGWE